MEGYIVAMFIDLKVFYLMDKKVLGETMRKKEVREELIKWMEEVVREIKSRVRSGEKIGKVLDGKGMRQGDVR